MLENYFGIIEMAFSFGVIIGVCLWQLRSVEKESKRMNDEEAKRKSDAP